MGGISKNAAWFIACNQYAAYVISGPLAWEQAQQNMDYLQSAIAWDKPELNPDGSIKRMSGDLPDIRLIDPSSVCLEGLLTYA